MKINNQKHSVALIAVALVLLLALVSSASAFLYTPTSPYTPVPKIIPDLQKGIHADFSWCPEPLPDFFADGYDPVSRKLFGYSEPVYFHDDSVSTFKIKSWLWQFGDGTSYLGDGSVSFPKNPQHVFYEIYFVGGMGVVPVTLTVTDLYGGTSTITKYVYFDCIDNTPK